MMKDNNLIDYLRNIDRGICDLCGNPKGHFGTVDKVFCYKCDGYEMLNIEDAKFLIQHKKRRLREEFKKIAIKSDIFYCLKVFLSIGESLFSDNNNNPIFKPDRNSQNPIIIDPRRIVIANLGVKWLLEDSLDHSPNTIPWNEAYCTNMMSLLRTWLDCNQKEKMSDVKYNLGFFVSKNDNSAFYYTQQYDFYLESLNKFGIVSPDETESSKTKNMLKKFKKIENDPELLKKYVRDEYPVFIATILNAYYTDDVIRPFSFDDMMDIKNKKLTKFLSKCNPDLIDHLTNKKTRFPELILALLESIYSYYYNLRATSLENITKDGYVIVRDLTKLTDDINTGKLAIPPFKDYIISSKRKFHDYPFIIEYNSNFIISPIRLWIGQKLLHYALNKDKINGDLAKKYEIEAMNEIEKRLKNHRIQILGREIKPSKQKGFEIDFIGCYRENILIIECKSFHPSPFFMMRKSRRYNNQFKDKMKRIDKIKTWISNELSKSRTSNGNIIVNVYDQKNKKPTNLKFPSRYHKINQKKILYLYITQIKEYYEQIRDDVIQVWYEDL